MASQDNMAVWRDCIRAWYPEYETKTYFVPPVVITRIPFDVVTVAGQSVLVPQCNPTQASAVRPRPKRLKCVSVEEKDTREDLSLLQVLDSLRELVSEQSEPMFIISQLQFSSYLREPFYAAAAKMFLRPQNLSQPFRQGDFDILVIHRHYGIITGEIKSVLSNQQQLQLSQPDVDRAVTDKVRNAIKQLNKSEVVLREITKDLEPNLAIRKLLILPYVTADTLTRVISSDEQLKQDLVTCLQAVDFDQALQCCLLASSSETETANKLQPKTWRSTFCAFKSDSTMTSGLYLDLLARFCGPATTVSVHCPMSLRIEVRTEGQGVAVMGERMMSLVLTPEQINLLTRAPTKVFLTGPPGVGKSVMLVLMALTWLRQGLNIHLVSVNNASFASTLMIKHMLDVSTSNDHTRTSKVGSAILHEYNFSNKETDVDIAINTLTNARGSCGPYVICDEFWISSQITPYKRFVTDLCTHLENVCLWVASTFYHKRPEELCEEQMTTPLRCPPAVLSKVQKILNSTSHQVYPYTTTTMAMPCDSLNTIHLRHQGPVHVGRWPLECVKCGQSIAGLLQRLGVGMMDSGLYNHIHTVTAIGKKTACPPLQYRDIIVLTRSADLRDDVKDEAGRVTSTANGLVHGLRDAGIPVRVIREKKDVLDTAVGQSDMVTVTWYGWVYGLERKVVVMLPGRTPGLDDNYFTSEEFDVVQRLFSMSRCSSRLVEVDVPRV